MPYALVLLRILGQRPSEDTGERFDSIEEGRAFIRAECDDKLSWTLMPVDSEEFQRLAGFNDDYRRMIRKG